MRLDGSLEDFGLPDVLHLLAQTRKTGSLHLETGEGPRAGLIRLGEGAIDAASSDLRRQALARRLVGSGLLSDDALAEAAADVRAGAPSLVRALLDRGSVPADELTRIASDQTTDAVCELLRWTRGSFSFFIGEADPDGLSLGLRAEDLVAEGQRRMQVWPSLTSHIPSPDTVLRLSATPPADPSCSREEWGLLALIDGSRSVSEIVALLGSSEFAVAGILAGLVERGLLTVHEAGAGFADLQRRQAVIAALEAGEPAEAPVAADPEPAGSPSAAAPVADVPQARAADTAAAAVPSEPSQPSEPSTTALAEISVPEAPIVTNAAPTAVTGQTSSVISDAPMTDGSAALDLDRHAVLDPISEPATETAPRPAAEGSADAPAGDAVRGLDSAVTKSLVLRLIAGVRGL